jgi:Heparinase II/III-like protein
MQNHPLMLDAASIQALLQPATPPLPELERLRGDPSALRGTPQLAEFLAQTDPLMQGVAQIPQTTYTAYRRFIGDGDRSEYEAAYFGRRARLAALALRIALGLGADPPLRPLVEDYLWAICEESSWVLPAHERCRIDLFAAETAFMLGDALNLLGDKISHEVRSRVRGEVERRIFEPYLRHHAREDWYMGLHNWNGVCNSSVAAAFLLLEPEPGRVAQALAIAFRGLDHFLRSAFEADGGSNEGVAYWHYGLFNLVALSEMLRARSGGAIDLLVGERMRQIAAYPARMQLSGSAFAAFSDCDETLTFHPGMLARLMARTGEQSLRGLLVQTVEPRENWRLTMMLRTLLWWDGERPRAAEIADASLPSCGVARIVGRAEGGAQMVLALKAGHNAENHNQNDIGSLIVHVDGENLLTDPGRGLYSRFYFGPQRYENIFANSYGHSVPRINGQLQPPGREYQGALLPIERGAGQVAVAAEIAGAYPPCGLRSLRRELSCGDDGSIQLSDTFICDADAPEIEEALITWCEAAVVGPAATITGERHELQISIVAPAAASFQLELLEEACRANRKPGVLRRLSVALPAGSRQFTLRMRVRPRGDHAA